MLPALLLVALTAAAPHPAQEPGQRLPEVRIDGLSQTEARSFDEFSGRLVLLEFFAHWCAPCAVSVKHLNGLERTFGARGFSVVAVTNDKPADAEPWIAKTKARYAWGYDSGGKLQQLFELQRTGIPFSALIDPFGTIVWTGHPMNLKEAQIERFLAGATESPIWTWPDEARALAPHLARGELGAARAAAAKLPSESAFALARLEERAGAMGTHFEYLLEREDYAEAFAFGERIARACEGFPIAATVAARLAEQRADPEVQKTLALTERLDELERRADKVRDAAEGRALRGEVETLANECAGRKLERRARKLLQVIDRALERQAQGK